MARLTDQSGGLGGGVRQAWASSVRLVRAELLGHLRFRVRGFGRGRVA